MFEDGPVVRGGERPKGVGDTGKRVKGRGRKGRGDPLCQLREMGEVSAFEVSDCKG